MSVPRKARQHQGYRADVLKSIKVLSKRTVTSPPLWRPRSTKGSMMEFSMKVHRDDGCTCKSGFEKVCPAWADVQLLHVELKFHTRMGSGGDNSDYVMPMTEEMTFALLDGKSTSTALRLKLKTVMPGKSKELISVFRVLDGDASVIGNPGQRTKTFPVTIKAVGIDVTSDHDVTDKRDDGIQNFKDLLNAGKIYSEVWSSEICSSSEEYDTSDDEELLEESNCSTAGACKSGDEQSKRRRQEASQEDEIGASLVAEEKPVNENLRKIGYLEFKYPKPVRAPSLDTSPGKEKRHETTQQGEAPEQKNKPKCRHSKAKRRRRNRRRRNYGDMLGRVEVVARRIEDLIRNANTVRNFDFFSDLCKAGVELPDSVTLEELGVSLYLMETNGIVMTEEQKKRRALQKETIVVDSDNDCGDSSGNAHGNSNISHKGGNEDDHDGNGNGKRMQDNSAPAFTKNKTTGSEREPRKTLNGQQSSQKKTLLQRMSGLESEVLSHDRLDSLPATLPLRVKNVEEALAPRERATGGEALCKRMHRLEDNVACSKRRMANLERQVYDETHSASPLLQRVQNMEEEMGMSSPNGMVVVSRIEELEGLLL